MSRWAVFAISSFFVVHGLVHLIGFVAYWRLAELDGVPYKTVLLDGRLDVGTVGIRVFGAAYLLAAAAFMAVALGAWAEAPWWRPLLIATALVSLVLTGLDWKVAHAGAVVDLIVLAAIVLTWWM